MMNEWILSSSVLIVLVLLGRLLLRGKISLRLQYALWAVVLVRLLLPVQIFTSDFGTGSVAKEVDIAKPVRQVYVSANEERYEKAYDEAYTRAAARYEAVQKQPDPIVIEQEARTAAEESMELDLTRLLYHLWMAGMAAMTLAIVSCNVHLFLRLKRRRWELDVPDSLLPVYITETVPTPCIFGFFRPVIYLTPDAAKDPQVRAHVLAHELTHYRHWDHVWSVLRSLCLVLHWYNPLVWIAVKVSRADAELACDEGALAKLGENQRGDYGRTLIGLTCSDLIGDLLLTATTMTGSAGSLRERIKLLMARPRNTVLTVAAVVLMVTLIVGCTFSSAPATTTPPDISGTGQEMSDPDGPGAAEFGSAPYFEALLNPQMYRTEADWYPLALNSFYDTPAQIDLYQLFYTGIPGVDNTLSAEEQAFLKTCSGYEPDFDTDRLPAAEMNRVLETYFGISLDETAGVGLEHFFYWEEGDCYYHCHSDTNLQFRQIIDCQNLGDGVWRIRYSSERQEQGGVTMQYTDGIWKVLSNEPVSNELPALAVHGDLFNAEGVLCYPGIAFFMTEEEVLNALGITAEQCMEYQKTSGEGMWANSFTVRRSDAFGVPMELCFTFRSYWPDEAPVLTEIYGKFDNRTDFEAVRQLYADTLGETDYQDFAGTEEGWKSQVSFSDLVGGAGYEILDRCGAGADLNMPASCVEWISDGSINWFTELPEPGGSPQSADLTGEVAALFAEDGDPWYLAALTAPFSQALLDFDAEAFFSAGQTAVALTDEEKAVITAAYGKEALNRTVFRMSEQRVHQVLDTYIFAADGGVLNYTSFLFCPETQSYLLVREEVPPLRVPEILACEQLDDKEVRMIYRFPGEEQRYAATLLKGENWKVYSNHLLLDKPLNARTLTEEEVAMVRAGFAPSIYDAATGANDGNPLACFTHSMYEDIREMTKFDFLCYFPATAEGTKEELALLIEKYPDYFDPWTTETMPLPVHRYDADALDDLMMEYAGISFRDLPDGRWAHYLEETDSYYNYTSDFGLLGFPCTGGWVYDGGAMLYTDFQPSSVLVLTERNGQYYIQAHLPALIVE